MVRVLVADDEAQIRVVLRAYLEREGYEVEEAATGKDALALATSFRPDLVLLDIGLPDMDGLEVLRQIRITSEVYVVMVTARAEEVDLLVGLSVGADDYVAKPFSPREVVARVKTVLRRGRNVPEVVTAATPAPVASAWQFAGLAIDPDRREVRAGDELVELSALEFDLLAALASSPGRVFSRAQLLERVWGYAFFGDERVVDVHVRNLRRALGDDATSPSIIGTVRGVGYKFLKEPG
ncbi:MAG TPA: response regulator transcription factor [Propionibacteriaceae bacterium]